MITIIKRGTKETQRCDFCGCVFSYEEEDVNCDPRIPQRKTIECPQCKNTLVLQQPKGGCNGL